jgi:8-oxo-dGTP pyrophosphatase MutT (NUDIX family)
VNDIVAEDFLKRLDLVLDEVPQEIFPPPVDPDILDLLPDLLRPAAVLVPLVWEGDQWELLLTKRTSHLKHHAGQIAFPGGRVEPEDRSPSETALRETAEEVGIQADEVRIVGCLDAMTTITGFQVLPVVGLVEPGFDLSIDLNEVEQAFQVPLAFVLDPLNCTRQSAIFRGRRRSFFVIQYQDQTIWGATAAMLVNFSQRLLGN